MGVTSSLGALLAAGLAGQAFAQQAGYGQCKFEMTRHLLREVLTQN